MALLAAAGPRPWGPLLFREPAAGRYILPLAAGVALSCCQAVLAGALNGLGQAPGRRPQRPALRRGGAGLRPTILMGLPGLGLRGYVAGFVLSAALGAWLLNWRDVRQVHRPAGPGSSSGCTAPGLAALLMGLVTRLLFLTLRSRGLADIPNMGVCLVFGGVFYLAALQAQGVSLRSIFFRK